MWRESRDEREAGEQAVSAAQSEHRKSTESLALSALKRFERRSALRDDFSLIMSLMDYIVDVIVASQGNLMQCMLPVS